MKEKDKDKEKGSGKKPKIKVDIKKMGVDIDKNEYREIVLSNSNHPDKSFYGRYR